MKKVKTIIKEYDEKGNVIKESITEEEYDNKQYPPLSPLTNVPITYYPQYHIESPKKEYEITIGFPIITYDTKTTINNFSKNMLSSLKSELNKKGAY